MATQLALDPRQPPHIHAYRLTHRIHSCKYTQKRTHTSAEVKGCYE